MIHTDCGGLGFPLVVNETSLYKKRHGVIRNGRIGTIVQGNHPGGRSPGLVVGSREDQTVWCSVVRADGRPAWSTTCTLLDGTVASPYVVLAERT